MPALTFTWYSALDARTCDKCRQLDGYKWYFYDEMPRVLMHPQFGVVWDMVVDESRAHGLPVRRGRFNCRCWVTWEINDEDLQDDLLSLRRETELLDNRLVASLQFVERFIALLLRARA